ncbi:DinB family protein [Taibaiella koreensis]|uniref:DinB family protein n=1 Tax=Taibaiella koreensis TaxID=1268548 RepID=UPI000E59D23C|nr:DinB family protein [Taibaiella koreensis]
MLPEQSATATQENAIAYAMKNFAAYNFWANTTLINWLRTKPASLMDAEVPSSFPTIRRTLIHILQTQQYWFSVISKTEFQPFDTEATTEAAFQGLLDHSATVATYIKEMTEEDLQDKTLVTSPWFECNFNNFEYLIQFVNHGTYHRGQVITIGRNLDLTDAPMTDYNYYNIYGKA